MVQTQLTERQAAVLGTIIREYIRTAEPVGSVVVRERSGLEASPATVRNEMAFLEAAGYLESPHTSAGRIPTERSYQFYVANFLGRVQLPQVEERKLRMVWAATSDVDEGLKLVAKTVASFATTGVFLAFGEHDLYYTGLTYLFQQPEFREQSQLYAMSRVLDHLEEAVHEVYQAVPMEGVQVLVGRDNPFGSACSVVLARCSSADAAGGLFGILGPMRMDYDRNVARAALVQRAVPEAH